MGFHSAHEDMTASQQWTNQQNMSLLTLNIPSDLFHFGYYHFSVSTKCYSCLQTMDDIYYKYIMIISCSASNIKLRCCGIRKT